MALTPDEIAAVAKLRYINAGDQSPGNPGGLGNNGHRDNFPDGLHAMADVTDAVAREAEAAATASASASAQAASLSGTSTTSIAISAGSKVLATQAGKSFTPGTFLLLTSNASPTTHYIFGQVTAYSGTSLTISVTSVSGSGSRADWTIRVAGGPGVAGKDVELQKTSTHIQWRLTGGSWTNLVALSELKGDAGTPIEIQVSATHIQWRYVGGGAWTNIVALADLEGDQGMQGPRGAQILNGARDPVSGDGANGDYWLQSADGILGELGDFWAKSGGTWTKLFNTRGAPGAGSGDVVGPNGGVVDGEIMVSNGTTGKSLKGAGKGIADLATAAQGAKADTALQPEALNDYTPTSGLADVATSGDYGDLENPPSIPSTPGEIGAEPAGQLIGINTVTDASYTLVLADAGKVVERSSGSANTVTVPPNSSAAFPVGARIDVFQTGTGQTTIVAGSGVTIRSADNKLALAKQYAGASLYKRATNEWILVGALA